MFSLPNQNIEKLRSDLSAILAYKPPHLSLYGLTIEEGTPFHRAYQQGKLTVTSDETWRAMYDHLVDTLSAHGLARYEVSNFAQPGHRSEHNQLYWQDIPYMGIGPGAHGYSFKGQRWSNKDDFQAYLAADDPTETFELLDPEQSAIDYLLSALRSEEGVSIRYLESRSGFEPRPSVVDRLATAGRLTPL